MFIWNCNLSLLISVSDRPYDQDEMDSDDIFIKEFKEAYEREYGESITDKEAREKFFRLVNLLRTIIYGTQNNKPEDRVSGS